MSLVADALSVWYPVTDRPAVDGVSLRLDPGELVIVAGPNGSGKSTLFRAMLGLADLQHGQVQLDDRPLRDWRRQDLARAVGALSQREEPAFPQRVHEAVMLGRWAQLGAFAPVGAADHAAVADALARTGISALAQRGTDTLSGGEWQRVRLARALAASPRYLLLDEPATALDLAHEMAVLELLRGLSDAGLGVLAITHHLNAAAQYADRVLLLDGGKLAASGAPADVLTADIVSRVFQWPVAVHHLGGAPHLVPRRRDAQQ